MFEILPVKPSWMSNEAIETLNKGYLLPGETPRDLFKRVAATVEKYIPEKDLAEDIFDILWRGFIGLATPVASNFGTNRGLPVSCYAHTIEDSLHSIYSHLKEATAMSKYGGGVGVYYGKIRPAGSDITGGGKSTGIVPWVKQYDFAASAVSQDGIRRGNFSMNVPIDHPDLPELLRTKDHSQGDPRFFVDSNLCVIIKDKWLEEMIAGDKKKQEIFSECLKMRMICGSPYILFIDTINEDNPQCYKERGLFVETSNLCSEIVLHTDESHSFVCVLSSLNYARWEEWKEYRSPNKNMTVPELGIYLLDAVCEEFIQKASRLHSMGRAVRFAKKSRALGMGGMGLHALYMSKGLPFKSEEARALNIEIHKFVRQKAEQASKQLAKDYGQPEWCEGTDYRHTHLLAIAPTRTNAVICGAVTQGIEPLESNFFVAKQAKGSFIRKNPYLEKVFEKYNKNDEQIWNSLIDSQGSVQHLDFLSQREKDVFLTAREIDQFEIIRQASDRQKYIDQSQSLNLFVNSDASAEYIMRLHLVAWKMKVKSLYYLRSNSLLTTRKKTNNNVIVTKKDCPYCVKAKEFLNMMGLPYEEISKETALTKDMWNDDYKIFPQIYISGIFIGGYDQLMEYYGNNETMNECVACEG